MIFAIAADVFEEEVSEGDGADAVGNGDVAGVAHGFFVVRVGAGPGEWNDLQEEACCCGLRFENFAASAVHGDAIEGRVDSGEEAGDLVFRIVLEEVQGPGAVFAAAPGDEGRELPSCFMLAEAFDRGAMRGIFSVELATALLRCDCRRSRRGAT